MASSTRPCRSRRSAIRAYASAATCGPGPVAHLDGGLTARARRPASGRWSRAARRRWSGSGRRGRGSRTPRMNRSATWHHRAARSRSFARSHATSMSQLVKTTVSSRAHSPPRVPAMASSISDEPGSTSPDMTSFSPSPESEQSSRSVSPVARAAVERPLVERAGPRRGPRSRTPAWPTPTGPADRRRR